MLQIHFNFTLAVLLRMWSEDKERTAYKSAAEDPVITEGFDKA